MEMHIIDIVRFATCILSFIIAIVAMIKADDNNAMRRLSALLAGVLIFFNEQIGSMVYLLIGSSIELLIATAGVGFVIVLTAVIMVLPIFAVIRWLTY